MLTKSSILLCFPTFYFILAYADSKNRWTFLTTSLKLFEFVNHQTFLLWHWNTNLTLPQKLIYDIIFILVQSAKVLSHHIRWIYEILGNPVPRRNMMNSPSRF